ncbi:MAG: dual specificity protein phosphatase family protein [Phycisphaerae bacterium]|nr:dual specificity protein phosphatase family protein [Phycisphaerae bacterium]
MPYSFFRDFFPDIADEETRCIIVPPESETLLPPDEYALFEMFCDEKRCDCRRVMFYVLSAKKREPVAVVAWGWESALFYSKWIRDDDPETIAELKGPVLNALSPQSKIAPLICDVVTDLLKDPDFVDRIKRHYAMFRARIDGTRVISIEAQKRLRKKLKRRR